MPANATIFLLGLAVGTGLLLLGLLLGYWLGRKSVPAAIVDRQEFLAFLTNLSSWTSEFSGDVSKYQSQLSSIDARFRSNAAVPREEVLDLLNQIMQANRQLQERIDSAEEKLDEQTGQISSYLTEARTDGLTGLLNRRAFDKATDELFEEWSKKEQRFSLGLIDIDHFKQINDTYGHPAGDAVLQHISQMLQTELRDLFCVARYGGEEFSVLSKDSAANTAAALEKLRQTVGQVQVTHDSQVIAVTLSAGTAEIEAGDKIGKLVRRADEALYAAKLGGRNRVYLHDGNICHLITKIASLAAGPSAVSPPQESRADLAEAKSLTAKIDERLQRIVEEESRRFVGR